ncbi:MAG: Lrp/AsnC family transcriptional regulator [Rhodospirillaceae bacterium]|nr:Lrp/AsnC family transcriptional regulator [Rhodospirillales bacterium]
MDEIDRAIINSLQGGFPICDRPFAAAAAPLGLSETQLMARIERLLADGVLTRFGPLWHAERLGGALSLCAMAVPEDRFDEVAAMVNAFPEVAHNYARDHALNMWFVIATEAPERKDEVLTEVQALTGLRVFDMPKIEELFVGLRFEA